MPRPHPRPMSTGPARRTVSTRLRAAGAVAGLVLATAACGTDADDQDALDPETEAACHEYNEITNQWGRDYGAEMGAVGEALANDDDERAEEAVATVRDLFLATADALREQADEVGDEELAEGFQQSAEGAEEIAEQLETYDDVAAAPEMMSGGDFAAGGEQVQRICAGADVPVTPVPTD